MRVAHVGNYKPDSSNGVDKTIAGLVSHLPPHGVAVEVWHPTQKARSIGQRVEDGVTIHDLPVVKKFKGHCAFGRDTAAFLAGRAKSVDLLHFHSVFLRENLKLAELGIPYIVTPNGGYDQLVLAGRNRWAKAVWLKMWERPYLRQARLIQAVSLPEVETLGRLGANVPIEYVPNGIDDSVLARRAPPPSGQDSFVYLGRLAIRQKGLDLLLRGYAKAQEQGAELPRLILAGPDYRGGMAELKDLAKDLGIAERVDFTGPIYGESKWALISSARMFLHTSRWEGMPFALLEAAALGRPLLISPGTNLAEPVAAAEAGIVMDCSVDDIAEALRQASGMAPDALDRCGARARDMVERNFSWRNIAGQVRQLYESVLTDRRVEATGS